MYKYTKYSQNTHTKQQTNLIFIIWTCWHNQQHYLCAQRRLRSARASVQSDQSLWCPTDGLGPCAERRLWSDYLSSLIWVFSGSIGHFGVLSSFGSFGLLFYHLNQTYNIHCTIQSSWVKSFCRCLSCHCGMRNVKCRSDTYSYSEILGCGILKEM